MSPVANMEDTSTAINAMHHAHNAAFQYSCCPRQQQSLSTDVQHSQSVSHQVLQRHAAHNSTLCASNTALFACKVT